MLLFMSFSIAELGLPPTIELWGHEWGRKMLQAYAIAHSYGTGDRTRLHQAEASICTTLTFCWLLPAILGPNVLLRIGSRNIYIRTGASATTPNFIYVSTVAGTHSQSGNDCDKSHALAYPE